MTVDEALAAVRYLISAVYADHAVRTSRAHRLADGSACRLCPAVRSMEVALPVLEQTIQKACEQLAHYDEPATCNSGHQTLPLRLWDCPECGKAAVAKARRDALESAAMIADELRDATYWDDPSSGIAARIRKLKEAPHD